MNPAPLTAHVNVTKTLNLEVSIFPMPYEVDVHAVVELCVSKAEFIGHAGRTGVEELLFWNPSERTLLLLGVGKKSTCYAYMGTARRPFDGAWISPITAEQAITWFEENNASGRLHQVEDGSGTLLNALVSAAAVDAWMERSSDES